MRRPVLFRERLLFYRTSYLLSYDAHGFLISASRSRVVSSRRALDTPPVPDASARRAFPRGGASASLFLRQLPLRQLHTCTPSVNVVDRLSFSSLGPLWETNAPARVTQGAKGSLFLVVGKSFIVLFCRRRQAGWLFLLFALVLDIHAGEEDFLTGRRKSPRGRTTYMLWCGRFSFSILTVQVASSPSILLSVDMSKA